MYLRDPQRFTLGSLLTCVPDSLSRYTGSSRPLSPSTGSGQSPRGTCRYTNLWPQILAWPTSLPRLISGSSHLDDPLLPLPCFSWMILRERCWQKRFNVCWNCNIVIITAFLYFDGDSRVEGLFGSGKLRINCTSLSVCLPVSWFG